MPSRATSKGRQEGASRRVAREAGLPSIWVGSACQVPEPCLLSSICPLAKPDTRSVTDTDTRVGSDARARHRRRVREARDRSGESLALMHSLAPGWWRRPRATSLSLPFARRPAHRCLPSREMLGLGGSRIDAVLTVDAANSVVGGGNRSAVPFRRIGPSQIEGVPVTPGLASLDDHRYRARRGVVDANGDRDSTHRRCPPHRLRRRRAAWDPSGRRVVSTAIAARAISTWHRQRVVARAHLFASDGRPPAMARASSHPNIVQSPVTDTLPPPHPLPPS